MTETAQSIDMLDPIEDRGGVAQPLLQVTGLTKHFPVRGGLFSKSKTVRAVDNVTFSIAKGETVIHGTDCINTSYPGFAHHLEAIRSERRNPADFILPTTAP